MHIHESAVIMLCKNCGESATHSCSCGTVFYCNKKCQSVDWDNHKPFCENSNIAVRIVDPKEAIAQNNAVFTTVSWGLTAQPDVIDTITYRTVSGAEAAALKAAFNEFADIKTELKLSSVSRALADAVKASREPPKPDWNIHSQTITHVVTVMSAERETRKKDFIKVWEKLNNTFKNYSLKMIRDSFRLALAEIVRKHKSGQEVKNVSISSTNSLTVTWFGQAQEQPSIEKIYYFANDAEKLAFTQTISETEPTTTATDEERAAIDWANSELRSFEGYGASIQ